jgi:hypothetical protein
MIMNGLFSINLFLSSWCFRYRFPFTCHLIVNGQQGQLTSHHARGFDFEVDLNFHFLSLVKLQRFYLPESPTCLSRGLSSTLSISSLSPFNPCSPRFNDTMLRTAISESSKTSKTAISKCKFSTTSHNLQSPLVYNPKIPKVVLSEEEKQKLKEEKEKEKQSNIEERKWKGAGDFIPVPIPVWGRGSEGRGGIGENVEVGGSGDGKVGEGDGDGGTDGGGDGGGGGGISDGFDWTDLIPDPGDLIG